MGVNHTMCDGSWNTEMEHDDREQSLHGYIIVLASEVLKTTKRCFPCLGQARSSQNYMTTPIVSPLNTPLINDYERSDINSEFIYKLT